MILDVDRPELKAKQKDKTLYRWNDYRFFEQHTSGPVDNVWGSLMDAGKLWWKAFTKPVIFGLEWNNERVMDGESGETLT